MHRKARFANVIFDPSLQPKNAVLAILLLLLFLIFVFLFLTVTQAQAQAQKQTAVPATARQAASMPQFAARLHSASRQPHMYQPKASFRNPGGMLQRGWLPDDDTLYSNGPINGTVDAWTINSGFVVSNSFTVPSGGGYANGLNFGAWADPGDVLQSVQVSITSSEFGGSTYYNATVNFTQSNCSTNQYGFNICTESSDSSFGNLNLAGGTYWLNLANAVVSSGDPIYWDENSGAGCDSEGCPSLASENSVGTIPSEAFTILGSATTTTITCAAPPPDEKPAEPANVKTAAPSPTQTYQVIYNFTGGVDGNSPNGLVIDAAGNLYGTTPGNYLGGGTVFKLAPRASGWTYTRLYAFSGPDGSNPDSTLALAANGTLYGTTNSGGAYGNGVLFGLSPPAHIVGSVFSNWTQSLLYSFTGGTDGGGPGGALVLDSSGNIYGAAHGGGVNGGGTVYEFSHGGMQVLHAFPAFSGDGITPLGVITGAGGLYGLTYSGGANQSGTVYTLAGGYNILYNLGSPNDLEAAPAGNLAADEAGNLYASATNATLVNNCYLIWGGYIFELTYPDWTPEYLASWQRLDSNLYALVTPDGSGNVYGTVVPGYSDGEVFKLSCCWTYTTLHQFTGSPDGANPAAPVVMDALGNIYGTTTGGGANGYGTIWKISP